MALILYSDYMTGARRDNATRYLSNAPRVIREEAYKERNADAEGRRLYVSSQ